MPGTIDLFVYGTLRAGHHNHHLMRGAEFLGEDSAPGRRLGAITVVPEEGSWVEGELYRLPLEALPAIDRLEGHPRFYVRTAVVLRSGRPASIYYIPRR